MAESREYNILTGELIPFGYSIIDTPKPTEQKEWEEIMFYLNDNNFVISVYGDLRDTDLTRFKKEFDKLLDLINENFIIEDVFVKAKEIWTKKVGCWTYSKDFENFFKQKEGIKYELLCND